MEGEAVKEMAERFAQPTTVPRPENGLVLYPPGWTVKDPVSIIDPGPKAKALPVSTLGAVRDYLVANRDRLDLATLLVHVESTSKVVVLGPLDDRARVREVFMVAQAEDMAEGFTDKFWDIEGFLINLQVRFVDADQRADLLKLLSNVNAEAVATSMDDGISQTVQTRAGVVMKGTSAIPNPVQLTAYRTFRDVMQPSAPFVLRARTGDELPKVALFEADGGTWRLSTIARVRDWLKDNLPPGVAIFA